LYRFFQDKRGRSYGGIFIAMKSDLIVTHRSDLDEECEILWLQLEIVGSKSILIGVFYRPPESGCDVLDMLRSSLAKIDTSKGQNIWLAGDFNLSHIDWESQSTTPNCPKPGLCRSLIEISNEFGLEQMVKEPTRGSNILDLFFTSNGTLVEKTTVVLGMSDHSGIPIVTINLNPKLNKTKPRKVFLYHKANWSNIKTDFSEISRDFEDICTALVTVDELWDDFNSRVKVTLDKNIPSRMVTTGKNIPWCDYKVKKALRQKKVAYNRAKKSDSTQDWERFRSLRKYVNRLTRSKYRKYIRNTCAESSKKFWSFIKSLNKDSFGITSLKHEGNLITDNTKKAEALNNQFSSVLHRKILMYMQCLN
jgi:hypothetical protein